MHHDVTNLVMAKLLDKIREALHVVQGDFAKNTRRLDELEKSIEDRTEDLMKISSLLTHADTTMTEQSDKRHTAIVDLVEGQVECLEGVENRLDEIDRRMEQLSAAVADRANNRVPD